MKRALMIGLSIILSILTVVWSSPAQAETGDAGYYTYNNGGAYLDTATVPQGVIVTGSSGQIRPLQDSIIKDTQYAFLYIVSDPSILAVDEKGNWQALKAGSVTLEIKFPASGQIQNFEDELDALGIQRAPYEPTVAYSPKIFHIEISDDNLVRVERLYYPALQTHLYTADTNERNELMYRGWKLEGVAWTTRSVTGEAVYRLYHPVLKVHHYTKDPNEYQVLGTRGWSQEGVAYRSTGEIPVYRLYHAGIKKHLYTTDANEKNIISKIGWRYEGVAWYVE